jgi:hypothetical protein
VLIPVLFVWRSTARSARKSKWLKSGRSTSIGPASAQCEQLQVAEVRAKDCRQHQQARFARSAEQVAEVRAKDRQQHQQTPNAA